MGTTTVGRILADRRGWPFFDLDEEIERHFGISIERLQARFLTGYSYHVAPIPPFPPPEGEQRLRRFPGGSGQRLPRSPWPTASSLEERIDEIMDRVQQAGDHHAERAAALEGYLALARAHEDAGWFDAAAWSEDLADSYLASGRVEDAVRTIGHATRRGYAEGAEMLCELAEKLMRSGHEPQARPLWQQARADYPDDVWVYVQAGIEYGDLGGHAKALGWLTTGLELALRTG